MGLNIKNPEVERLAAEVARRFGETKTEAIRKSLEARMTQSPKTFDPEERKRRAMWVLENVIWPSIPPEMLGKSISKEEQEEILGIGPHGY